MFIKDVLFAVGSRIASSSYVTKHILALIATISAITMLVNCADCPQTTLRSSEALSCQRTGDNDHEQCVKIPPVETAIRKITRAEDIRTKIKLIMQPNANWVEFLEPAPASLAILGHLILISSKTDFSINKNPPKDGFRFIRYPDSFRASLMQVANSGWTAFNVAHKNMDQIRLLSSNVESHIREIVRILIRDEDQLVQYVLPNHLQNIQDIADECVELSETTEKNFEFVIRLIHELLEAFLNAKGSYEDEKRSLEMKITKYTERQKAEENYKQMMEKSLKQMNTEVDNARKSYEKAIDEMPGAWEILGMNFVEDITDGVGNILNIVTLGFLRQSGAEANPTTTSQPYNEIQHDEDTFVSIAVFSKSGQVLNLVNQMQRCIDHGTTINFDMLYADEKRERMWSMYWQEEFEQIEHKVVALGGAGKPSKLCIDICEKAISICKRLKTALEDKTAYDESKHNLVKDLKDLQETAMKFDTQSKAFSGASSFTVTPPHLAKTQQSRRGSAGQVASDNVRFKAEQTHAHLNYAHEAVTELTESLHKSTIELAELLVTLQNCRVQDINFDDTIKMLNQGLEAMGKMKEQWGKMVRFFQMISGIIKIPFRNYLTQFVESGDVIHKNQLTYSNNQFMKDVMYQQAQVASVIASLVNMISGTYFEISDRFLMDRVNTFGKLMSLSPNDPDFEAKRAELNSGCEQAQESILRLAVKNKMDFERKLNETVEKMENELQAGLPAVTDDELQRTKKIVASGMQPLTAEDEDQFV